MRKKMKTTKDFGDVGARCKSTRRSIFLCFEFDPLAHAHKDIHTQTIFGQKIFLKSEFLPKVEFVLGKEI